MAERPVPCEPETARTWRELGRALRHPRSFLAELGSRMVEDDIFSVAAGLAYYFFLSIFPLVLFVLALASVLPVEGLEQWLLSQAARSMPADAYGVFDRAVRDVLGAPRGGLLSVGAGLALWAASAGFGATINGLNRAYRVEDPRPWWHVRLFAIGLTVGLALLMVLAFVLTIFGGQLVALTDRLLGPVAAVGVNVVRWVATLGAVTITVAAIYYACPAKEREWQWIRPGAVFFTVGFLLTSAAFSYYVTRFGAYSATYGSLGAVIILLLWLYLLSTLLLAGGELNAYLEGRAVGRVAGTAEAHRAMSRDREERSPHGPGAGIAERGAPS